MFRETDERLMQLVKKPIVIDLFAGCGGLTEGFANAGFDVIAAVENDKYAAATYRTNHPDTVLLEMDIRDGEVIEELDAVIRGREVDVIIGGPPCQSFSIIGRAKDPENMEKDPRNKLVDRYAEIVDYVQPKFLMMENVPGILNAKFGKVYDRLRSKLRRMGYIVHSEKLNAAHYGVPQLRNRIIFIGNRIGIGEGEREEILSEILFPKATHWAPYYWYSIEQSEPAPHEKRLKRYLTVRDAIADLPPVDAGSGINPCPYAKPADLTPYQKLMRKGAPRKIVYNHIARFNNKNDLKRYAALKPGQIAKDLPKKLQIYRDDIFEDKFKRQSWERPSTTIVAHMHKDGNMFIHPEQVRSLTPREAARIQSFPDRYRFEGPTNNWYKQIGNAVPPLMAEAIATHLMGLLMPESLLLPSQVSRDYKNGVHVLYDDNAAQILTVAGS